MAMSADGKIASYRRESSQLGSPHDKRLMNALRTRADAVIIGSGTVRADGYPLIVRGRKALAERARRGAAVQPVNVVLSASLNIPLAKPLFHHPDTEKLVFTSRSASRDAVRNVGRLATVVVLASAAIPVGRVVAHLERRGIGRILVEGGGETNYSFIRANLVDEIFITVTPFIIGGKGAPTVVDGRGFLARMRVRLELISSRRVKNELFLRYRVLK
jgi:5-amino-6-(5-phosphoribosylamino)uracil reductase